MENEKCRNKPGPKPITYIPPQFCHIEGVDQVTTHRQLRRLREYIQTPAARRAPYVRLGASVPHYGPDNTRRPSATYAVSVDGVVFIIKRSCDPRRAERWFSNSMRPWNLSREFADVEVGT